MDPRWFKSQVWIWTHIWKIWFWRVSAQCFPLVVTTDSCGGYPIYHKFLNLHMWLWTTSCISFFREIIGHTQQDFPKHVGLWWELEARIIKVASPVSVRMATNAGLSCRELIGALKDSKFWMALDFSESIHPWLAVLEVQVPETCMV